MSDDTTKSKRPKTGGRTKGTANKITADARAAVALIVQGNIASFQKKMRAIKDPKDWCDTFIKLMEFNLPKLQRVEATVRHALSAEQLTDAELAAIAGTEPPATDRAGTSTRTH